MSDAVPLPPRPNFEQYKKLAKDFQKACKSGKPDAIAKWATNWLTGIAQLKGEQPAAQVEKQSGREAEAIQHRWHIFQKSNPAAARCALSSAQFFIAREHGFASWPKFSTHVGELQATGSGVSNFEAAADAIVRGDDGLLQRLLQADPDLIRTRSTREHRSTLLHYVSANGIEDFRQKTPKNIVKIARLLLDAGAEVDAESDAYGGGCTALGLVATSVHPERAGVQIPLLQLLLERGASMNLRASTGNQHSLIFGCLANGQPKAAEFFAALGAPMDLETAAPMGRLDLVKGYFDEGGIALPATNRKQMESGFLYACGYGQAAVVEFLLQSGIEPGLRSADNRTGLHWAAYGAQVEVTKILLRHGTPIDVKDKSHEATALDVALWSWEHSADPAARKRCLTIVALLAKSGAVIDPQQWTDPVDGTSDMLDKIRSDAPMQAALRGEISAE